MMHTQNISFAIIHFALQNGVLLFEREVGKYITSGQPNSCLLTEYQFQQTSENSKIKKYPQS